MGEKQSHAVVQFNGQLYNYHSVVKENQEKNDITQ